MNALALLTTQHRHIEELLACARAGDAGAIATLADYVTMHLGVEQELLTPLLSTRLSKVVLAELRAEHMEIRRVLAELCWFEDEDTGTRLAILATLLEGHAAWQEEELFATLTETLPAAALGDLGTELVTSINTLAA